MGDLRAPVIPWWLPVQFDCSIPVRDCEVLDGAWNGIDGDYYRIRQGTIGERGPGLYRVEVGIACYDIGVQVLVHFREHGHFFVTVLVISLHYSEFHAVRSAQVIRFYPGQSDTCYLAHRS